MHSRMLANACNSILLSCCFPIFSCWMLNSPLWCCGLLLHFKSHESKTAFVSSIAGALLLQPVTFVTDKAVQEGHHLLLAAISSRLPFRMDRRDPSARSTRCLRQYLWTYVWGMASVRSFCGLNISARHCGRID